MDAVISKHLAGTRPLFLETVHWPDDQRILVMAPHPDDFDAIAVTMRFFHRKGHQIHLRVISSSAGGVEDSFCYPPTAAEKVRIRESEQKASCRLFGLTGSNLRFLRMPENSEGHPLDTAENFAIFSSNLQEVLPDLVFLPHGNDTNPGHRLAFAMLRRFALQTRSPILAFLNRDPKTLHMKNDLYTFFDEQVASWKAELLRCHQSQHQRNLNTRGCGLDERILRVNRMAAADIPGRGPYAEVFEIWTPAFNDECRMTNPIEFMRHSSFR